jgi:hypothetical protein
MFNFLNPAILLAAGAAVLLPLLIHIFNRQKVKTITFSSLLFLRSLEKTRMRRVKIMEYLLLIIRTLIILLVVAAFARPAIKGGFATGVGAHAKTSVVILLDNSYSMGYDTKEGLVFDLAKKKAKEILGQLNEGDQASLILFASKPRLITTEPTYAFRNLIRYLDEEVSLSSERTDVGAALNLAYLILRESKNLNREIYLISDMDASGWSEVSLNLSSPQNEKSKLFLVNVSPPSKQNIFIEEIDFGNQLIEKGKPFQISARIANYGFELAEGLLVSLYLDGKRVIQADANVEREGKTTVRFAPTVAEAGIHTGFFEVTDDDLLIDNRRFFAFQIPEAIRVLLVGENQRDTYHLKLSLNPSENADANKLVSRKDRTSLSGVDYNEYQVIILSNVSHLSEVQITNLERFVQKGGGVFFIPGENSEPEFYSQEIAHRFFDFNLRGPLNPTKNTEGFYSLDKIDLEHPIFQIYQHVEQKNAPPIRFSTIFELPENSNVKTLLRFNLGKPALVEKSLGRGKLLLLAAPMDEKLNDLVIHPFFVPMINRSVEYLASDLTRLDEDLLVGSEVFRELSADFAGKEIELVNPQMKRTALHPSFKADKLHLNIVDTSLPGIYSLQVSNSSADQAEIVDRFVVNIDPGDSDPRMIDNPDLEKKLEGTPFVYVNPQADMGKSILQSRYGRELWKTFLWIAFGLLALEMVLVRTRKKEVVAEEKR